MKKWKNKLFMLMCFVLFICAVFSLDIIAGMKLMDRASISYAFLGAFTVLLLYNIVKTNISKGIIWILVIFTIIFHGHSIAQVQMNKVMVYDLDKVQTITLLNAIQSKYPDIDSGKYKLYFYGRINNDEKILDRFSDPRNNVGSFYSSIFRDRIINHMYLFGLSRKVKMAPNNAEIYSVAKNIKNVWPDNDSIQLYKNIIIIKLGVSPIGNMSFKFNIESKNISSADNLLFSIGSSKFNKHNINVSGWAYIKDKMKTGLIYVGIKDKTGKEIYYTAEQIERPDVVKHFNNNEDLLYSGFKANIKLDNAGDYTLSSIIIEYNGKYHRKAVK